MGDGTGWEVWRIRKELETKHPDESLERQDGTKVDSLPPCCQPIHTFSRRSRYLPCHMAARTVVVWESWAASFGRNLEQLQLQDRGPPPARLPSSVRA